jgi:hypothetical protein
MARTTATRTIELAVGDTVRFGNMFDGFEYATVAAVEKVEGRPQSRNVHIRFNHGGVGVMLYGVGSVWDVVKETSNANI